jgi:hypothetical protein
MKTKKFVVAVVAMCAMFATEVNAQTSSPKNEQPATLKVIRGNKSITKITAEDTITAVKTRVSEVSDRYKMSRYTMRLLGKEPVSPYFNNTTKDIEGNNLNRGFIELQGGPTLQFSGSELRLAGRVVGGWETKRMLFFANLGLSSKAHNDSDELTENGIRKGADATGAFTTYDGTLNVGLKFWQDDRYRSYVAFYLGAGYGFSKTDGEEAEVGSSNSGFLYLGGLKGKWGVTQHLGLTCSFEFGNIVRCMHDSDQDLTNFAGKAFIGVSYTF